MLFRSPGAGEEDRFAHACRIVLGRPPRERERALARDFLAATPAGEAGAAAWAQLVQALLASADFRYLD